MGTVFKRDVARALSDANLKIAIDRTTVTAERKRAAALADSLWMTSMHFPAWVT